MSFSNVIFSDFKIIGLKEGWSNFNGPVYFCLLGSQPEGKPPIKVEVVAFDEAKKQMKMFKVRNGSRVVAATRWQTYKKNGKDCDSFRITDLTLMPFEGQDCKIPQRSTVNMVLADYRVSYIKKDENKSNLSLVEYSPPSKDNPPINVVACAFEETMKQMDILGVKKGSRIMVSAKWQTYMRNEEVMYSYKITDVSLMENRTKKTTGDDILSTLI